MKLPFDPAQHGWHFPTNIITHVMGVKRNNGLCGGMSLAAVNYFRYGINIPSINFNNLEKFTTPGNDSADMHCIFDFILHSQFAVFESANIIKQKVGLPFFNTKENHYTSSVNNEFPRIKNALDKGCFVIIGLRSDKEDYQACHQTLVYGYEDKNNTLYMYDSNYPNEEVTVKSNGYRLIFSHPKQYCSYYLLMTLNPNVRSNFKTYDSVRNQEYNFSVKPPVSKCQRH